MPAAFEHGLVEFFSTFEVTRHPHHRRRAAGPTARSRLGAHPSAGGRPRILRQNPRAALQPAKGRRRGRRPTATRSAKRRRDRGAGQAAPRRRQFSDHLDLQPPHGGKRFPRAAGLRCRRPPGARRPAGGRAIGRRVPERCSATTSRWPKPRKASACWRCAAISTRRGAPPLRGRHCRPAAPARAATSSTPGWNPTTRRPPRRCSRPPASIPSSTSPSP